jgi:predicted dehydrogenase
MRVGIVGLGFMGATHARAWQSVSSAKLAAVVSSDAAKLAGEPSNISGNLGRDDEPIDFGDAKRYGTFAELIADEAVDAVDLCTPSYLHAEQAAAALAAGKHVLVEKPMATSLEDCRRMLAAAAASGKVLMVGHVLRFWPDYMAALRLIRSGALGKLRSAFLRRKCAAPAWSPWLRDKSKSGGAVLDLLIHDFDFCRQLLGVPSRVEARGIEDSAKGIDLIEARLDYSADSPQVLISGGWHHPASYPFSMEFTFVCDEGTLDFRSGDRALMLHRADGSSEAIELAQQDGFAAELAAFVAACRAGKAPDVCPPEESADAVAIAAAADESRQNAGTLVSVERDI